ncbi:MAG: sodium:calcium antiporter [Thomasclavelia sp.]|nr:sodium:calcium antiporter [Thomasclavelia sp.]
MIYVLYLCVACGVTLLSIKAADYVDLIDRKTSLSGAFIGGIMLSAVTSLPELFTSISSTLMLNEPGLCIGNILGSDLFNLTMLAILLLISFKEFSNYSVSRSHNVVIFSIIVCYIAIVGNMLGFLNIDVITVSITSIIIIGCYIVSFKHLASEDGSVDEEFEDTSLSLKDIVVRFIIVSIGIIALSIIISYVTDDISIKLNLGKGIAGAIFMGIATSLPEVTSSIALVKKKKYDIAIGNIVGSNIFNLGIMAVVDILYVKGGIYDFTDPKTVILLISGLVGTTFMYLAVKFDNKYLKIFSLLSVVMCYVAFLVI